MEGQSRLGFLLEANKELETQEKESICKIRYV